MELDSSAQVVVFASKLALFVKPDPLEILRAELRILKRVSHSSPSPSGAFMSARVECGCKFKIRKIDL